jgi:WD40 repeat protein
MIFEDARTIPHPIIFHPTLDIVIIQTRHGGFLWDLASDARVLMTTGFAAQSGYYSQSIRNFSQLEWDLARGQILTVTVENPAAITAFDFAGNQVGFVELDGARDARFEQYNGSDHVLLSKLQRDGRPEIGVWKRTTGEFTQLNPDFPRNSNWSTHISPDGRYLVATVITRGTRIDTETGRNRHATYRAFHVWDFENLKPDFTANTISGAATYWPWWSSVIFKSPTVIQTNDSQWDILTGNMLYEPATYAPAPVISEKPGAMGIRFWRGPNNRGYAQCRLAGAGHNLFVHHDGEQLVFKEVNSGEIVKVVSDNDPNFAEEVDWTPGCRYVFFRLSGEDDGQERLEIWDAETLQPIPLPFPKFTLYNWSPDGEQVILRAETGSGYSNRTSLHLWQPKTGALIQLAENPITFYTHQVYWDYARGQILMAQSYGFEVYAFDLSTGQLRNRYRGSSAYTGYYVNTEAGRGRGEFNVFGGQWLYIRGNNALTLFNLDTGENQQVWVAQGIVNNPAIDISPDGRYLVIGHDGFRVWDLSALAVDVEARIAQLYAGPAGRNNIQGLRFVSDTLIEVTTIDGAVSRWDVTTGAQQP